MTRGRFSGSGLRPGCGLRSRGACAVSVSRRASASTSSRVAPGSSSASNSSCRLLSVSLRRTQLLNPPLPQLFFAVPGFSTAPSAVASPVQRCARERSRWGSSILREQAKMFQSFLCRTPVPLAWLRLLQIEPVHQHRQLLGAHGHAALFLFRLRPTEAAFLQPLGAHP